jgi:hypothetical protein
MLHHASYHASRLFAGLTFTEGVVSTAPLAEQGGLKMSHLFRMYVQLAQRAIFESDQGTPTSP